MPVVYQVPALIKHPFCAPLVVACKNPFPKNGVCVAVAVGALLVLVAVDAGKYFGTYLIPVAAQSDLLPSGEVGTNSPVCTLPRTL